MRFIRYILYTIVVLLFLFIGLAIFASYFFNVNDYKPQITSYIYEKTGKNVIINGDINLSFFPQPTLLVKDISIDHAIVDGYVIDVNVAKFELKLHISSLLKGELKTSQLSIKEPIVHIKPQLVSSVSTVNHKFQTVAYSSHPKKKAGFFEVEKIEVQEGKIIYGDEQYIITKINGDITSQNGGFPYSVNTSFYYGEIPLKVSSIVEVQGHTTLLLGSLKSDVHEVSWKDIRIDFEKKSVVGQINLKSEFEKKPIRVTGNIFLSSREALFKDFHITFEKVKGKGHAKVIFQKSYPYDLTIIDLPYKTKLAVQGMLNQLTPFQGNITFSSNSMTKFAKLFAIQLSAPQESPMEFKGNLIYGKNNIRLNDAFLKWGALFIKGDFDYTMRGKNFDIIANFRGEDISKLWGLFKSEGGLFKGPFQTRSIFKGNTKRASVQSSWKVGSMDLSVSGDVKNIDTKLDMNLAVKLNIANLRDLGWRSGRIRYVSQVIGTLGNVRLQGIDADLTLGSSVRLKGNAQLNLEKSRPYITADLTFNQLTLDKFFAGTFGVPRPRIMYARLAKKNSGASHTWSREPLPFDSLKGFDGQVFLQGTSFRYGTFLFNRPLTKLSFENDIVQLNSFSASAFEGKVAANGTLDLRSRVPKQNFTVTINGANLRKALFTAAEINLLNGQLSLNSNLNTHGNSLYQMVSALSGNLNFVVANGDIQGIDFNRLSSNLMNITDVKNLLALTTTVLQGGKTPFRKMSASFNIRQGVARSNDFVFDSKIIKGGGGGTVDLPRWFTDFLVKLTFIEHSKIPSLGLRIKGPLNAPSRNLDIDILQKFMIKEGIFKVLDKVIDQLGINSNKSGEALQKKSSPSKDIESTIKKNLKEIKPKEVIKGLIEGFGL